MIGNVLINFKGGIFEEMDFGAVEHWSDANGLARPRHLVHMVQSLELKSYTVWEVTETLVIKGYQKFRDHFSKL